MSHATKWNKIDSVIFFCESRLKGLKQAITESAEADPDPEEMIRAETEHLKNENERLKKREIPLYLIEDGKQFFCPKCQTQVPDPMNRYCSNCGNRIIKHIPIDYKKD